MITSAICMVKGISSQKLRPHASTICGSVDGVASSPAVKTTMVASKAKTNASGTQRSVQAVRRRARWAMGVERSVTGGGVTASKKIGIPEVQNWDRRWTVHSVRGLAAQIVRDVTEIPQLGWLRLIIDPTGATLGRCEPK